MSKYDQAADSLFGITPAPAAPTPSAAATVAPANASRYEAAADELIGDRKRQTDLVLRDAAQTNPEQAAKAVQIARRTALPPDVTFRNLPELEAKNAALDASQRLEYAPLVAEYLRAQPWVAKSAGVEDVANLTEIEQAVRKYGELKAWTGPEPTTGSVLRGLAQSLPQGFRAAREGLRQQMGDLFDALGILPRTELEKAEQLRRTAQASGASAFTTPNFESSTAAGVYGGLASTLRQAPGIALSIATRSSAPVLASIGVQTQAEAYGKYRTRGATPGEAFVGGTAEGAVEVATELLPMSFLVNKLGRVGMTQFFTGLLAREIPGEQLATLLQDAIDTAIANPDKTWADYLNERPEAAYQTLVATITQSAVMGGVSAAARRALRDTNQINDAETDAQRIGELFAKAGESKLRERDPQAFAELVQGVADQTEGAPKSVYIDAATLAETLQQSGMTEAQLDEVLPGVAAQLPEALAAGGTVELPIGDLVARVTGTPLEQALLPNLRTTPDALSQAEAQEAAGQAETYLQQQAERVIAEATDADAMRASAEVVKANVLGQLNATKRFRPDVNEAYATLARAFYTTMAGRTGVTPEEMFARYPLRIVSEQADGGVLDKALGQQPIGEPITKFKGMALRRASASITTSAESVFESSRVLPGVYDLPLSGVTLQGVEAGLFDTPEQQQRIADLAEKIRKNGSIEPVFVGRYQDGEMYVMEGQHRARALQQLGYTSIPARIVEDTTPGGSIKQLLRQGDQAPRATFSPSRMEIALLKDADLSSFLHEMGHFFLEVQADLASQPGAPQQIVDDFNTVLKWFGIKGDEKAGGADSGVPLGQGGARAEAVRAVDTGKRSPITGKNIIEVLDTNGNVIESTFIAATPEEALQNYRERPARQAAARAAAPAPTYYLPEPEPKEKGSNWRRVKGQKFTSLDEDDGFLYHITSAPAAKGVRDEGLVPNAGGMFGGFYANYSAGKVFVTERSGVSYWMEKVGQQLEAAMDNPPAVVVMRIPKGKVTAKLTPDEVGSADANAPAFFSTETVAQNGPTTDAPAPTVKRTPAETWRAMTLDQKRPYHERWAESWEQYLFEGKAPSVEMRGVFQRFREFMISAYKSLKNFLRMRSRTIGGQAGAFEQPAYHGTPYRGIEKFDTSKIGTGEGAQAYGWGLYFAGRKEIAEHYRKVLANDGFMVGDGSVFDPSSLQHLNVKVTARSGDLEAAIAKARSIAESDSPVAGMAAQDLATLEDVKARGGISKNPGQLYEVDIPEDSEMLLWDKPLSEQPAKVREALKKAVPLLGPGPDQKLLGKVLNGEKLSDYERDWAPAHGQQFYKMLGRKMGDKAASEALAALGIKGIKYLDGVSRNKPLRDVKREFLAELPEDAGFDDVTELLGTGTFSPKNEAVIKALAADDWLGFDYPAQALSAALSGKLQDFDASPALVQAVADTQDDSTYNYVIFSGDDVAIRGTFYQSSTRDQTETPEFKAWFGDSKVVDAEGKPLVVYHGTPGKGFTAFDTGKAGRRTDFGNVGVGVYTTPAKFIADAYAGVTGTTMPLYASVVNPLRITYDEKFQDRVAQEAQRLGVTVAPEWKGAGVANREFSEQFTEKAQAAGHDGVLTVGTDGSIIEAVAFRPEQIKSATQNDGTFDANDPSILSQGRTPGNPLGLSDEVRGVFDRLIATDEQIAEAQSLANFEAVFKSAEQAGMTPEEWAAYQAQNAAATAEATETLQKKSLADMKWVAAARSKALRKAQAEVKDKRDAMRAEVTAEVAALPIEQARAYIKALRVSTPEQRDALKDWGDRRDAAMERAREEVKAALLASPEAADLKGIKKGQFLAKNKKLLDNQAEAKVIEWEAANPRPTPVLPEPQMDSIAEQFGFTSGDELAKALVEQPPAAQFIEALTEQRLLETYGEVVTADGMARAANEAVHNEARRRFVATELAAMQRAMSATAPTGRTDRRGRPLGVNVIVQAAKSFAETVVNRRKILDLKPAQHAAAATRAAAKAAKLTAEGKTAEAIGAKRDQLLSEYTARYTEQARQEVEKGLAYLKKFDKASVREKLPADYVDQIDQMLERFEFKTSTTARELDRRASLAAWVASQQEMGLDPVVPQDLLDNARLTSYKQMTVEEFRGLVDGVKSIEHLARLKSKLLAAKDQREFDAIADEIAASIVEHGGTPRPVQLEPDGRLKKFFKGAWADHRKLNSLVRQMDGGKDNGPFYRALVRSMNDAGARENTMLEQATEALAKIYAPIEKLPGGFSGAKLYIPEISNSLSRAGRLSIALNWGNPVNRERVLEGDGWTEAQVNAILRTLSPVELKFVNDVWAHLDTYWPEVKAKQLRVSGVVEDKVDPVPFEITLPSGEVVQMRGGYYPLKYDTERSIRAERQEAVEKGLEIIRGAIGRATTRRSHTQARGESGLGPVRKDLSVITQHVNQVVHDLAWHEWFVDANRLLNDKRIASAIRQYHGNETARVLKETADAIAVGDAVHQGQIDRLLLLMRANVTRSIMGASLTTAILQPFGLTQSMARVGVVPVLKGAARWAGSSKNMENSLGWINQKSEFMRLRSKTFNRELREISQRVQGKSKLLQVYDASLFMLMQKLQMVADVPTWIGAYEKALAGGVDESAAVALADEAVLGSQGGGTTKDLSAVQRNMPFLTQFYSYFNTTLNLVAEKTATTDFKNPKAAAGWMADMALLVVIPAILPALLTFLLKGGGEDDEPEEWAKRMLEWQAGYMFGMFVGLRELPTLWSPFDYAGPPAAKILTDGKKVVQQAGQGEIDDPAIIASINLLGTVFGLPTVQITRSYKGWQAWSEGDAPASSILFGPPPKDN